ncbi:bifunctional nuclease family protein [Halobaculum sp. CBA1158]|uniref:bifunctional nuclease family protein n=1 Tax=Halobaculum sp. CBA1158 TaxID=2904243 RepID=UPI001F35859A|nr:bifunctional nuclease family protein [Halobaculum sp. CBA1158]UIO98994.1 bifunctional nuclease family protein [Halobaculum sp. CBA1158]
MDHEAEVAGIGVGVGPDGEEVPAVVLRVRGEYLPIFVTPDQARSIRGALAGEPFDRPLTHDLLVDMVTEFGGAIDSVRIDDLADGTFYGKVDAERYEDGEPERFVFDARPSDAVGLAARVECPILVDDAIVDEAGQPPEAMDLGDDPGPPDVDDRDLEPDDRGPDTGPGSSDPDDEYRYR